MTIISICPSTILFYLIIKQVYFCSMTSSGLVERFVVEICHVSFSLVSRISFTVNVKREWHIRRFGEQCKRESSFHFLNWCFTMVSHFWRAREWKQEYVIEFVLLNWNVFKESNKNPTVFKNQFIYMVFLLNRFSPIAWGAVMNTLW